MVAPPPWLPSRAERALTHRGHCDDVVYLQTLSTSRASSTEATICPTSSIAPWTKKGIVGALDPRPVLREDPRPGGVDILPELELVPNEDLEAVGTQRGGAFVDERALVRREERTGEVDLQDADAIEPSGDAE
jgi:hypothetical protein